MSTARILRAAIAGGAGACLGAAAGQADQTTLNVRPGLWEMTISTQNSGAPLVSQEALARLSPAQRAKLGAAMAAGHTLKSCVTEKTLQRGFDIGEHNTGVCTRTVVSSSATAMDERMECASGSAHVSGHSHFDAPNPSTINGTVEVNILNGAHAITMNISGKWVSADCGAYAHNGE